MEHPPTKKISNSLLDSQGLLLPGSRLLQQIDEITEPQQSRSVGNDDEGDSHQNRHLIPLTDLSSSSSPMCRRGTDNQSPFNKSPTSANLNLARLLKNSSRCSHSTNREQSPSFAAALIDNMNKDTISQKPQSCKDATSNPKSGSSSPQEDCHRIIINPVSSQATPNNSKSKKGSSREVARPPQLDSSPDGEDARINIQVDSVSEQNSKQTSDRDQDNLLSVGVNRTDLDKRRLKQKRMLMKFESFADPSSTQSPNPPEQVLVESESQAQGNPGASYFDIQTENEKKLSNEANNQTESICESQAKVPINQEIGRDNSSFAKQFIQYDPGCLRDQRVTSQNSARSPVFSSKEVAAEAKSENSPEMQVKKSLFVLRNQRDATATSKEDDLEDAAEESRSHSVSSEESSDQNQKLSSIGRGHRQLQKLCSEKHSQPSSYQGNYLTVEGNFTKTQRASSVKKQMVQSNFGAGNSGIENQSNCFDLSIPSLSDKALSYNKLLSGKNVLQQQKPQVPLCPTNKNETSSLKDSSDEELHLKGNIDQYSYNLSSPNNFDITHTRRVSGQVLTRKSRTQPAKQVGSVIHDDDDQDDEGFSDSGSSFNMSSNSDIELTEEYIQHYANTHKISKDIVQNQIDQFCRRRMGSQIDPGPDNSSSPRLQDVENEEEIARHGKVFGFVPNYNSKIYLVQRLKKLHSLNRNGSQRRVQEEIENVKKKLTFHNIKRTKSIKQKPKKSRDVAISVDPRRTSKLKSSMSQISELDFKPAKQESNQFEAKRRKHFYRGMEIEDYHEFFDAIYLKWLDKHKQQTLKDFHMEVDLTLSPPKREKLLTEDSPLYQIWKLFRFVSCFISLIIYPLFTVNGFPDFGSWQITTLIIVEGVFVLDMALHFFLLRMNSSSIEDKPQSTVASHYLHGQFLIDSIAIIPAGLLSRLDPRFKILWLLKSLRLGELQYYTSMRFISKFINSFIAFRQGNSLKDPRLREETNQDLIYITEKIYIKNIIKIARLIFITLFIVYYVSTFWLTVVQTQNFFFLDVSSFNESKLERGYMTSFESVYSFISNEHWDISGMTDFEVTTMSMYFALTSLTTTGLGDYYPVTKVERMMCTILLLCGISLFSYVLSEFRFMIKNFKYLNCDLEQNEKLEEFFVMLQKFNAGRQLSHQWQNEVREFMKIKWNYDKNNFLLTEEDKMLLQQLPTSCQTSIYTDFLFKEFLWSFRRFFSFTKKYHNEQGLLAQQENKRFKLNRISSIYNEKKLRQKKLTNLKFPFYTYQDEQYCQFMISVMNYLEIRKFPAQFTMANEMEESLEIFFVEKGTYDIGYEINKTKFFRLRFGASTQIGGFQIAFMKRFMFIYQTHSNLDCLSLRKERLLHILEEFPEFKYQMKKKFFQHYYHHVYAPLMKRRNIDILDYNYRSDYKQVIFLQEQEVSLLRECITRNQDDMCNINNKFMADQIDINSKLHILLLRFNMLQNIALRVFMKSERVQRRFYDVIINIIMMKLQAIDDGESDTSEEELAQELKAIFAICQEFHEKIVPPHLVLQQKLSAIKSFECLAFDSELVELRKCVLGDNPYSKVKAKMMADTRTPRHLIMPSQSFQSNIDVSPGLNRIEERTKESEDSQIGIGIDQQSQSELNDISNENPLTVKESAGQISDVRSVANSKVSSTFSKNSKNSHFSRNSKTSQRSNVSHQKAQTASPKKRKRRCQPRKSKTLMPDKLLPAQPSNDKSKHPQQVNIFRQPLAAVQETRRFSFMDQLDLSDRNLLQITFQYNQNKKYKKQNSVPDDQKEQRAQQFDLNGNSQKQAHDTELEQLQLDQNILKQSTLQTIEEIYTPSRRGTKSIGSSTSSKFRSTKFQKKDHKKHMKEINQSASSISSSSSSSSSNSNSPSSSSLGYKKSHINMEVPLQIMVGDLSSHQSERHKKGHSRRSGRSKKSSHRDKRSSNAGSHSVIDELFEIQPSLQMNQIQSGSRLTQEIKNEIGGITEFRSESIKQTEESLFSKKTPPALMVPKTAIEVKFEELRRASELTLENVSSAADGGGSRNKSKPLSSSETSSSPPSSSSSSSSSSASKAESSSRQVTDEASSPMLNINESLTQPPLFVNLQQTRESVGRPRNSTGVAKSNRKIFSSNDNDKHFGTQGQNTDRQGQSSSQINNLSSLPQTDPSGVGTTEEAKQQVASAQISELKNQIKALEQRINQMATSPNNAQQQASPTRPTSQQQVAHPLTVHQDQPPQLIPPAQSHEEEKRQDDDTHLRIPSLQVSVQGSENHQGESEPGLTRFDTTNFSVQQDFENKIDQIYDIIMKIQPQAADQPLLPPPATDDLMNQPSRNSPDDDLPQRRIKKKKRGKEHGRSQTQVATKKVKLVPAPLRNNFQAANFLEKLGYTRKSPQSQKRSRIPSKPRKASPPKRVSSPQRKTSLTKAGAAFGEAIKAATRLNPTFSGRNDAGQLRRPYRTLNEASELHSRKHSSQSPASQNLSSSKSRNQSKSREDSKPRYPSKPKERIKPQPQPNEALGEGTISGPQSRNFERNTLGGWSQQNGSQRYGSSFSSSSRLLLQPVLKKKK